MSPCLCALYSRRFARGFTLVELAIIVVMIGVIAGLILPALAKARQNAQKATAVQCVDNGRSIGAAFQKYAQDHDGALVPATRPKLGQKEEENWTELLNGYVKNDDVWHCPGCRSGKHGHFGVGYNRHLSKLGKMAAIRLPDETVAFGDTGEIANPEEPNPDRWREVLHTSSDKPRKPALIFETPSNADWKTRPNRMVNRHLGRASVIFADGHVELKRVRAVGFEFKAGDERALWDNQ